MSSQRKELFTERRAKQAELRLLQRKVDMAELVIKTLHSHNNYIVLVVARGSLHYRVLKWGLFCSKADLAIYYW